MTKYIDLKMVIAMPLNGTAATELGPNSIPIAFKLR